jgi:hypothetical protein
MSVRLSIRIFVYEITDWISIKFVVGLYAKSCRSNLILVCIGQIQTILYVTLKMNLINFIRND